MPSKLVDPKTIPTQTFDWGLIKPLVAKANTHNPAMAMLHVVLLPGKGHTRHNHPDADEILYILAGHGEQMVDCLLYTSPSPRDLSTSRMPSSA